MSSYNGRFTLLYKGLTVVKWTLKSHINIGFVNLSYLQLDIFVKQFYDKFNVSRMFRNNINDNSEYYKSFGTLRKLNGLR